MNTNLLGVDRKILKHVEANTLPEGWLEWQNANGVVYTQDEATRSSSITIAPDRGVVFVGSRIGINGEVERKRGRQLDRLCAWATELLGPTE